MKTIKTIAMLVVAAGVATAANAAQISSVGHVTNSGIGSLGPLAIGGSSSTNIFMSGVNTTVSGVLNSQSYVNAYGQFIMQVAWDDVNVTTCHTAPVNFTVSVVQDFAVPAQYQDVAFNSFTAQTDMIASQGGQSATMTRTRSDGGVLLPASVSNSLLAASGGRQLLDGSNAFATKGLGESASIGSIYRVTMNIAFSLTSGGQLLSLQDCNGIEDTTMLMVPLPTAAWAGIGGLVMVGGLRLRRKNQHAAV